MSASKDEILRGSIYRTLVKLGIPLAISEMAQVLYDLANVFWLGRIGKDAVAAPSSSWPLISVFIAAMSGLLASGTALVSQYRGASNEEGVKKSVGQVYFLGIFTSIIIGIFGFLTIEFILRTIGIPSDVLPYAVSYSRIFFISILFISLWESFRAVVSAAGNTILPMKLNIAGIMMNALLDPFLILGIGPFPRLEVSGAALSTLFSRFTVSLISLKLITDGSIGVKLERKYMRPDMKIIKLMLKIGGPLSVSWLMDGLGFTVLTAIISTQGSIALAAWGVGDRPMNLLHFAVIGFIGATSIMVGQSLGAGLEERAREVVKKTMILIAMIGTIGGLTFAFLGVHIASFFIDDQDVVLAASQFFLYMGLTIVFFELIQLMGGVAQGSGHTRFMMVISLIRIWLIRNLLSYVLGPGPVGLGIKGIWMGMSLSNLISGTVAVLWLLKGNWWKPVIGKKEYVI
ncbi:MAG: MATE family efflux transporter [Fervidicoccaceae archaeon]